MERSFKKEVQALKLGEGETFHGEGILAVTKALLQSGVSYVGGYQGAPVSHLLDVLVDAEDIIGDLGVHLETCTNEASAAAMLGASINYPLRGLVTTSHTRVEALPDVPTLIETGISNYEADIFYGVVAPAKTPPEIVNQLSGLFVSALKAPDMKPKLAQQGLFPVGICGAQFGAYLQRMVDDYTRIIREANITVK